VAGIGEDPVDEALALHRLHMRVAGGLTGITPVWSNSLASPSTRIRRLWRWRKARQVPQSLRI